MKKYLWLFAAIIVAFSLAFVVSCGGNDSKDDKKTTDDDGDDDTITNPDNGGNGNKTSIYNADADELIVLEKATIDNDKKGDSNGPLDSWQCQEIFFKGIAWGDTSVTEKYSSYRYIIVEFLANPGEPTVMVLADENDTDTAAQRKMNVTDTDLWFYYDLDDYEHWCENNGPYVGFAVWDEGSTLVGKIGKVYLTNTEPTSDYKATIAN